MGKKEKDQELKDEKVEQQENTTAEKAEKNSTEENSQENEGNQEKPSKNEWETKYNEVNDKYLRLYSEFDNFRKRTMKEKADLISSANIQLIKDLLPILDDFERAMVSNEKTEDKDGLKEGFQLIYNKMNNILKSKGLKPMDAKGKPFDMDVHEAITNIPAEKDEDKGKVIDVVEKGYFLNEKVVRYAKVVVGQ